MTTAELDAIRARAAASTRSWMQDRADRDALLDAVDVLTGQLTVVRAERDEAVRQRIIDAQTIKHLDRQVMHAQSRYDALDVDFKALDAVVDVYRAAARSEK